MSDEIVAPKPINRNRDWVSLVEGEDVYEYLFPKVDEHTGKRNGCYVDRDGAVFCWSGQVAANAQMTLERYVRKTQRRCNRLRKGSGS